MELSARGYETTSLQNIIRNMEKINENIMDAECITMYSAPIWGEKDPNNPKKRLPKVPERYVSLKTVGEYIRSKEAQRVTELVRSGKCEKKVILPSVVFQGRFSGQTKEDLLELSGLTCLDFDHVDNPAELKQMLWHDEMLCPLMAFISPSGKGVKVVVEFSCTSIEEYERDITAVWNYVDTIYGVKCDAQCKNVNRLCFLCYDSEVLINDCITLNTKGG